MSTLYAIRTLSENKVTPSRSHKLPAGDLSKAAHICIKLRQKHEYHTVLPAPEALEAVRQLLYLIEPLHVWWFWWLFVGQHESATSVTRRKNIRQTSQELSQGGNTKHLSGVIWRACACWDQVRACEDVKILG